MEIIRIIALNKSSFYNEIIKKIHDEMAIAIDDYYLTNKELDDAKIDYEKTIKYGAEIVTIFDESYPKLLKYITNPPLYLTILGNKEILSKKSIAIVGSRSASHNGLEASGYFAKNLSKEGWVVVSGLAKGIDAKCHENAINSTIAVIGGGISSRYPIENAKLYDKIVTSGSCIITEFSFDTKTMTGNFPMRNRIIAGISYGALVVEAGLKSGSLITARLAREFNREVFALPGFVFDPRYAGSNYLIKNNLARLIESIDDIEKELEHAKMYERDYNIQDQNDDIFSYSKNNYEEDENNDSDEESKKSKEDETNITNEQKMIYDILSSEYISFDQICNILKMKTDTIQSILMQLEMDDLIISHSIRGFCRKFNKK